MKHTGEHSCAVCAEPLAIGAPISEESFYCQVRAKFGERFTNGIFRGATKPFEITCSVHGVIKFARAKSFLGSPNGCGKCGRGMLTEEQFLEKVALVQGPGFKYELVGEFIHASKASVRITCPGGHVVVRGSQKVLTNNACWMCHIDDLALAASKKITVTFDVFLERARAVHGARYTYFEHEFKQIKKLTVIQCRLHGPFTMRADSHVAGNGCYTCDSSSGEKIVRSVLEDRGLFFKSEWTHPTLLSPAVGDYVLTLLFPIIKYLSNLMVSNTSGQLHGQVQRTRRKTLKDFNFTTQSRTSGRQLTVGHYGASRT